MYVIFRILKINRMMQFSNLFIWTTLVLILRDGFLNMFEEKISSYI